jgi:hypothetical protein
MTTLFVELAWAARLHRLAESIPGLFKSLQIRAQCIKIEEEAIGTKTVGHG